MTNSHLKARPMALEGKHQDRIDALMHDGVKRRVFPGAVLLVGVDGEVALHRAYGMADLFSTRPMTCETRFDLASLTKPLATAVACMVLVQQGRLELDRPCGETFPEAFKGPKKKITPRHLLSHRSGLPAWRPYYLHLQQLNCSESAAAIARWIRDEPLTFTPGDKEEYSDLGYLLLQHIIEATSGQGLDRFVREQVYDPLNLSSLFFVDLERGHSDRGDIAATELCPWRNQLLCGQVHDDNAFALGGIAGHAGLFGTAGAVFGLLQALVNADQRESGRGIFDHAVVRTFFQRRQGHRYALGFDTPSASDSSAGKYFPADSVGHLGFTGTSFWTQRSKPVTVVLLTNRVHPSRFNSGIKSFRPQLHDVVMESICGWGEGRNR